MSGAGGCGADCESGEPGGSSGAGSVPGSSGGGSGVAGSSGGGSEVAGSSPGRDVGSSGAGSDVVSPGEVGQESEPGGQGDSEASFGGSVFLSPSPVSPAGRLNQSPFSGSTITNSFTGFSDGSTTTTSEAR